MSDIDRLFEPLTMGATQLANRMVMAPLTRNRANDNGTVKPMHATYYAQRATAGLIISEATQISAEGKGYIQTPGIHSEAQVEAWRTVTDAVHAKGGKMFCQIWHVGRVSHVSLQPDGQAPVAPSAIAADTQTFTHNGFEDTSTPRALEAEEIKRVIGDFVRGAENAMRAGFDGVEVHGANGYLIDQFLQENSNQRTDAYGGSPEKRTRFLIEVVEAVAGAVGANRTGLRLSPTGAFNGVSSSDPETTFSIALRQLANHDLAYVHMVEQFPGHDVSAEDRAVLERLRALWPSVYVANGGFDRATGAERLAEPHTDLICYGRPFIANPDLVARFRQDAPLNTPDQDTFYGGDEKGYTDYPFLSETEPA